MTTPRDPHHIEESLQVYLRVEGGRWIVDGPEMHTVFDGGARNEACECGDEAACEEARLAADKLSLPGAEELVDLLREAVKREAAEAGEQFAGRHDHNVVTDRQLKAWQLDIPEGWSVVLRALRFENRLSEFRGEEGLNIRWVIPAALVLDDRGNAAAEVAHDGMEWPHPGDDLGTVCVSGLLPIEEIMVLVTKAVQSIREADHE